MREITVKINAKIEEQIREISPQCFFDSESEFVGEEKGLSIYIMQLIQDACDNAEYSKQRAREIIYHPWKGAVIDGFDVTLKHLGDHPERCRGCGKPDVANPFHVSPKHPDCADAYFCSSCFYKSAAAASHFNEDPEFC